MRLALLRLSVIVFATLFLLMSIDGVQAQSSRTMTEADVEQLIKELSNWGRWGEDDQLGALNLITAKKRQQAAALVEHGVSVSLARDAETLAAADNPDPFKHRMLLTGASPGNWCVDTFNVAYHGYAHTHMDSLCHLFHHGKMFNGFSREQVTEQGAAVLSIRNVKEGIFTRGILMDIPKLRGVKYLEPGSPIYPEELVAWENRANMKVSAGDVVFIYTGRWARRAEKGAWGADEHGMPGLHASCVRWLRERDIAMLGSDAASDVLPSGVAGVSHPIHLITLHAMGVHIFDNCDLEALSQAARKYQRWYFLLTASPIPVVGGTGSPLNPIATY